MTKSIKIYDGDVERINKLVDGPEDEMTWGAKVSQIVNKAAQYESHD